MDCLKLLYARCYSSLAEYSRSFDRDQIIELFQEAIARSPILDDDGEDASPARTPREHSGWILNLLLEYGWLERQIDEASLSSSYAFSRFGRLFTQPMLETSGARFRTRHRNTRNTRNSLQSFLDKGEAYDLLDAFEYSERIISDFTDVIAELDERKRQLVKEVEAQQLIQSASDEFFQFMENRFMPDLAVRLSADSVEKYRDQITDLTNKARRKRSEFKADAERELRKLAPELLDDPRQSIYLKILDNIDQRLHRAAEIMLPALRHALHGFTRRADIIIRQLSFNSGGAQSELLPLCQQLAQLSETEQDQRLQQVGDLLAEFQLGFVDPDSLRLPDRKMERRLNTDSEDHGQIDQDARRNLYLQQVIDQAFSFNSQQLRNYIFQALQNQQVIRSSQLPINNANELLMLAHAIEVAASNHLSSEFRFKLQFTGEQVSNEFFSRMDDFTIELQHSPT